MLLQQREISHIQERTAALRRKIKYAEEHPTDFEDAVSDTDVSEYTRIFSEYGQLTSCPGSFVHYVHES